MVGYRNNLGLLRAPDGKLQPLNLNDPPAELHFVLNFFEHMGYLLERGYLRVEDVLVEFHFWILNLSAVAHKLIKSEQADNPIYYKYFEKMADQLRDPRWKLPPPTSDEIEGFYTEESHAKPGSPIPRQSRKPRRILG